MQECVFSVIIRNIEKKSIGCLLAEKVGLFFHTLCSENHTFHNNECSPPKVGISDGAGRSIA